MKVKYILILISCFLKYSLCKSQSFSINPMYYHIFDKDSLAGFDENTARNQALSEGNFGLEFKIKMFHLKRAYIEEKYNLFRPIAIINTRNSLNANRTSALTGCMNDDFEASPIGVVSSTNPLNGWTIVAGYNGPVNASSPATLQAYYPGGLTGQNSCNLLGCCPMPSVNSEIIDCSLPGGYVDPNIFTNYHIYSVFGTGTVTGAASTNTHITGGLYGTKVLRINDLMAIDYSIEKLSKTFVVTTQNSFFEFAFISVLYSGHSCCESTGFHIDLTSSTNNSSLPCSSFSVYTPSDLCNDVLPFPYFNAFTGLSYTAPAASVRIYNPWKMNSFDLSAYIGQTITLDITMADCASGGHYAYMYFDAQCGALNVNINNNDFIAADSVITFNSCDSVVTLKAPHNFTSYQWAGPFGISSTNAILTTTSTGVYTLTLNKESLCSAITKTINVILAQQAANIVSSNNVLCEGSSAILSISGVSGGVWNTGSTSSSISVSPSVSTTYSYSAISPLGCFTSASLLLKVEDCTGLKSQNITNKSISVYPNPNHGEFVMNIETKTDKAILSIESTLGQLVYRQSVQEGKNIIKTKDLATGIYYYTLTENEKVLYTGKLQIE